MIVKINYDVSITGHDGYCSDPGEFTSSKNRITKFHPVLKIFNRKDFDSCNAIHITNEKLRYYRIDPELHGHCESGTIYTIRSAKLYRVKINDITFD